MIRRLVGLAQIALAATLASAGVAIAGWAEPEVGVITGGPGSRVVWVLPGGPSWRDGTRAGQVVLELKSGADPTVWRLVTTDGEVRLVSTYGSQRSNLRAAIIYGLAAAALVAISILLITRTEVAVAIAGLSLVFSDLAVAPSGNALLTSVAAVLALLLPIRWLTAWGFRARRVRLAALTIGLSMAGVWLVSRFILPTAFEWTDYARAGTTVGADLAVGFLLTDIRHWRRRLLNLDSERAADLVVLVVVLALAVFVGLVVQFPVAVLVALATGAVLIYPGFRHGLARAIDQIVLGDIRDRASIAAVEDERGRIARDLHDAPLQEIAAVIRQLDHKPDTSHETDLLRGVADRLRRVTTELRPPILDDLGLRAAIAYAADRATSMAPGLEVRLRLLPDDPLGARPPAAIELAAFRIIQEAVDNAVHHAEAKSLEVSALVLADEVEATVEDDGRGVAPGAEREARRAGHLGLISMAQRAAAIGADFSIERVNPHGTRVRLSWHAPQ